MLILSMTSLHCLAKTQITLCLKVSQQNRVPYVEGKYWKLIVAIAARQLPPGDASTYFVTVRH